MNNKHLNNLRKITIDDNYEITSVSEGSIVKENLPLVTTMRLVIKTIQELYEKVEQLEQRLDLQQEVIIEKEKVISNPYEMLVAIIEKDKAIGVVVKLDNKGIEPLTVKDVVYQTNDDRPITINQVRVIGEHSIGDIHSYNIQYQIAGTHKLKVTLNVNGKPVTVEKQFTIK